MRYLIHILTLAVLSVVTPVNAGDATKAVARAAFEEFERQMIHEYFRGHPEYADRYRADDENGRHGKKPGKKEKGLPPGIASKLKRGGTLPPGIAKKQLPSGLERNLPKAPDGYERTVVGNDVLLVEIDTGEIADVITDVILGD